MQQNESCPYRDDNGNVIGHVRRAPMGDFCVGFGDEPNIEWQEKNEVPANFPIFFADLIHKVDKSKKDVYFVDTEAEAFFLAQQQKIAATSRPFTQQSTIDPKVFEPLRDANLVLPYTRDQTKHKMLYFARLAYPYVQTIKIVYLPPNEGRDAALSVGAWFKSKLNAREHFDKAVAETGYWLPPDDPNNPPIFHAITADYIEHHPGKAMLLSGLLGRGDIAMMYGMPGAGKSLLVLDMLASLALGLGWADGKFPVATPFRTLYCTEEGAASLPARVKAVARKYGVTVADLIQNIDIVHVVPQLFLTADTSEQSNNKIPTVDRLVSEIRTAKRPRPALVVIDTYIDSITGANENDAAQVRQVLGNLRRLIEAFNCAVLFIHHTNKEQADERGSSAFRGKADMMMKVSEVEQEEKSTGQAGQQAPYSHLITCSKMRDGKKFDPIAFNIVDSGPHGAVAWVEVPATTKPKASRAGTSAATPVTRRRRSS